MPVEPDITLSRLTFGTAEPFAEPLAIAAGPWRARYANGTVRSLSWKGTEILRGVDSPIRDESWRTAVPEHPTDETGLEEGVVVVRRRFTVMEGALACAFECRFDPAGDVSMTFRARAEHDLSTCRAGLTLLHPTSGVAGSHLRIEHPDGSIEESTFPDLISPSQPAFDIRRLRHRVGPVEVEIAFDGDVFEMEDQRNWTDASFKTYCRPLSWEVPFKIRAGETVSQSIRIAAAVRTAAPQAAGRPVEGVTHVATPLLAVEDGWWPSSGGSRIVEAADVTGLLARIGSRLDVVPDWLITAARAARIDLEIVIAAGADPAAELTGIAARLSRVGITPERVIALPEPYLKSYQPDATWPAGPTPTDAARAAAAAFPEADIGVGVLTNFTELNRCRPAPDVGNYLTHGTSAIVHAADDESVFQTLEALGDVYATARDIAGRRPCRLGLSAIGMRDNPYGTAVADNPARERVAMALDDPRHGALFGAAFAVGLAAAAADAGCEAFAPAAPTGPFGLTAGPDTVAPIFHVVRAMALLAGLPCNVHAVAPPVRGVRVENDGRSVMVAANCGLEPCVLPLTAPSLVRVLDGSAFPAATNADWLETGATEWTDTVDLAPCAIAFVNLEAGKVR